MISSYRDLEPISKQFTIVAGLTVVGFMAFGLMLSFYRNVLFEETLQKMSGDNAKLRETIAQSRSDLEYYESAQYKDKYAKENFGKLNRGEKLLIITSEPKDAAANADLVRSTAEQEQAFQELLRQMPIVQHWNLFLFHRDQVEKLKKQL